MKKLYTTLVIATFCALNIFAQNNNNTNNPTTVKEYLNAAKQSNGNFLNWRVACGTAPSINIALERSTDSKNFSIINAELATALRCEQAFSFTDLNPTAGINYYRLKLTAPDGLSRNSNIAAVLNNENNFEIIGIFPNPFQNHINLIFPPSWQNSEIECSIFDLLGKKVYSDSEAYQDGTKSINLIDLLPNFYILTISNKNTGLVLKYKIAKQ